MSLRRLPALDPLGTLLSAVGVAALVFLPFVVFKANRIVPGEVRSLLDFLPAWAAMAFVLVLLLVAVVAVRVPNARLRLAVALAGVIAVAIAIAVAGNALTPPGNKVVR
ncbi:MAG TPA: hypothetical protein VF931_00340, partial [Steroidobacteraceae bacterium]